MGPMKGKVHTKTPHDKLYFLPDTNLEGKIANGYGCLAAQIVAHFKTIPGNIYLYECNDDQDSWQDYTYTVYPKDGEPNWISIYSNLIKECIFVGTPEDLIEKYAETEETR